jgi:hypothetical protein
LKRVKWMKVSLRWSEAVPLGGGLAEGSSGRVIHG